MIPTEPLISSKSNFFFYFPSVTARETFFYPVCTGHFIYKPGYLLRRDSYDSFLLMYIQSGSLTVEYDGRSVTASQGSFVFLDCYEPHGYGSSVGWDCIWCHFDGPLARKYFDLIVTHLGHVFCLDNPYPAADKLREIYEMFARGAVIQEPLVSKYLTDICTFFLSADLKTVGQSNAVQRAVSYISEHFSEPLTVEELAAYVNLSPYHFIRIFKRETGFTPHEYLLHTRMNAAKYLLRYTQLPVKSVCFAAGFSSESVFCTAFKKFSGQTPKEYRGAVVSGRSSLF